MQNTKRHIDFDAVPEGLEFRQEYLDAALGKYRHTKRAMLYKRLAYVSIALLVLISGSVGIVQFSKESENTARVDSVSTKPKYIQETSPTIDLEPGEGIINEHRQSPAVESVEATQDLSSRATDLGDPMSSGVGLPGQLSQSRGKITPQKGTYVSTKNQPTEISVAPLHQAENINSYQEAKVANQEDQSFANTKDLQVSSMTYLPLTLLPANQDLMYGRTRFDIPERPWSLYAAIGLKLWADHGFHSRPYSPDASVALGLGYKMNNRLTAQFQTQFNTVSGIADPYVVEQRSYDAGFNSTTYRYYTDRFYEVGAGLDIQAKVAGNHSVGIGWSTRYLLTADNHIETGMVSTYESLQETRVAAKGYVEGFETIRHSIRLNYEYALGKNKSVGAFYEHGLTDITKNTYFGNTLDRNSMLSVYFRLKLIP